MSILEFRLPEAEAEAETTETTETIVKKNQPLVESGGLLDSTISSPIIEALRKENLPKEVPLKKNLLITSITGFQNLKPLPDNSTDGDFAIFNEQTQEATLYEYHSNRSQVDEVRKVSCNSNDHLLEILKSEKVVSGNFSAPEKDNEELEAA